MSDAGRLHRAVAALLLAAGACVPHAGGGGTVRLGGDDVGRRARLLRMTDTRAPDSAVIDEALARGAPAIRAAAALSIGQLRSPTLAPRARALLIDPDTGVAASAAWALGLLRDTMSIPALATALDRDGVVAIEAAWALGEIGEPARPVLDAALRQRLEFARPAPGRVLRAPLPEVTVALLLAVAKLRPVPVASVVPFLGDGRDSVGWAASYALSRQRVPDGARHLLALGGATNPMVRAQVARGLAYNVTGDSLAADALGVLARLAADPHPHVRINAARALATFGARGAAPVARLARDPDANVRIAAAQSLASAPPGDGSAWRGLWAADTGFAFRAALLSSAMRHRGELPDASSWRVDADWRRRAAFADAIGSMAAWIDREELLRAMLADADPRVRVRAIGAVASLADSAPGARAVVERGLGDPSAMVRSAAIAALTPSASAEGASRVLDLYAAVHEDPEDDLRRNALAYLAAAWRRDSAAFGPDLLRRVAATAPPREASDLAGVESSGVFRRWTLAPRSGRALDWYEERVRRWVLPALAGRAPRAELRTDRGTIVVELFGADAPITADNLATLARRGYYRGTRFHRVVPNFVAQDGDPTGTGSGGPGYAIRDELNRRRYERGVLGMALAGRDTGGSQWFLTHAPQPHLDGGYTVFGRILSGWDALDSLVQGDRLIDIVIR